MIVDGFVEDEPMLQRCVALSQLSFDFFNDIFSVREKDKRTINVSYKYNK